MEKSELADLNRVRELLSRLDEVQRESEFLRERISALERARPEWPDWSHRSRLFDGAPSTPITSTGTEQ